jgi:hypothetical protein
MIELEFNERSNVDSLGYSADDKKFLAMMNNDCIKVDVIKSPSLFETKT